MLDAARSGQTLRVDYLLSRWPDLVDYRSPAEGVSALHGAASSGFEDTVTTLLQKGADCNAVSPIRGTPLCVAAAKGKVNIVQLLLEKHRAEIDAPAGCYGSPLHAACISGSVEAAKLLLKADGKMKHWSRCAPLSKTPDTFEQYKLLQCQPLSLAAYYGQYGMITYLTSEIIQAPEGLSYYYAHEPTLLWLEENLATVETPAFREAVGFAIRAGKDYSLKCILDSPLHTLAVLQKTNDRGDTPLIEAVVHGSTACVAVLFEKGASLSDKDKEGYMAIDLAEFHQHHDVVAYLKGPALRAKIVYEACEGSTYRLEKLLEDLPDCKALIEAADNFGITPLMAAAEKGRLGSVKILVNKGASVSAERNFGLRAVDMARSNGHKEVAEYLEEQEPKPLADTAPSMAGIPTFKPPPLPLRPALGLPATNEESSKSKTRPFRRRGRGK